MQDAGTARTIKTFVCPPNASQRATIMAVGDCKLKTPALLLSCRTSVSKYSLNLLPVLEKLGKFSAQIARRANQVRVSRECVEAHGPNKLNSFPKEAHMS